MGMEIAGEMARQGYNEGLGDAATLLREQAHKLWDGKSRINQIDKHVYYVLIGLADEILRQKAKREI